MGGEHPLYDVTPSRHVRGLIDDVVAEMSARLDESATAVTDAIHEACPLDDGLYLSTRQSTRANLGLITTLLTNGSSPTAFTAPEEALSYARSYVHEGLSFDLLTRAYREGEHAYSRIWLQQLHGRASTADELADAMGYFSDWLFAYIGAMNGPLSEVYTAEHERWIRGGVAMRLEEVRAVLSGAELDELQASSRLRYRLDGRHLGFIVWSEEGEAGQLDTARARRVYDEMDRLAGAIADSLCSGGSLSLPIGNYYAGWVTVGPDEVTDQLPEPPPGLRIALGQIGRGIEGFRRTHQEALRAKRVASLSDRSTAPCVDFGSFALDALLTTDLDEARRFVARELGPLTENTEVNQRLKATLEVFLHEESSFVRAARRLGIHENTVAYRVRRAEELLGRRVSERQLELQAALRLAQFL